MLSELDDSCFVVLELKIAVSNLKPIKITILDIKFGLILFLQLKGFGKVINGFFIEFL